MKAPESYVAWVNSHVGFNPRGQSHSDHLTQCVFKDLAKMCRPFARDMKAGKVELRPKVGLTGIRQAVRKAVPDEPDAEAHEIDTNIDGVIVGIGGWKPVTPVVSPIALENKTIMTAHGKARKNRYGDMRAFASHVHGDSPSTIAAFAMIVNTALDYRNPDAFARTAKKSGRNLAPDAAETIRLFTGGTVLREKASDPLHRVEALLLLAIRYDGVRADAELVPAMPGPNSPFSYAKFLERLCRLYGERYP